MNHADHVALLRPGIPTPGGVWADLGSGGGAFTLALAELIGPAGALYSVDKDRAALRRQEQAMRERFPTTQAHYLAADFARPLDLPPLDGIVMANALHFVPHAGKEAVVTSLRASLKPGGRLILVEYNVDRGNVWVPHPLSFESWVELAARCGFAHTQLLATRPSSFLNSFYSAASD